MVRTLSHLFPVVEADHAVAALLDVVLLDGEHLEPRGVLGQRHPQLPRREVDAGDGDRLGRVAHEHVRPQRVVHEVPANRVRRRSSERAKERSLVGGRET